MDRLPIISSKKIKNISYMCHNNYTREVRGGDIPANEDGAVINTDSAFYNMNNDTDRRIFEIPDSLTNLGSYFLSGNSNTGWDNGGFIQVFQTVPPTITATSFHPVSYLSQCGVFIYVPDESLNAYKTATNWSAWASIIKPASEKPAE
jgi:hypothetical protein